MRQSGKRSGQLGVDALRPTPVWPTNTIRICQSDSHTFTVVSRDAVTKASTSSQYARSDTVLQWATLPVAQALAGTLGHPCQAPPVQALSRFVQIPAHIHKSPVLQVQGEDCRAVGHQAAWEAVRGHRPQSQTLQRPL